MTNHEEILELLERSFQSKLSQQEEQRLDYLLREDPVNGIPFKDELERQEMENRLLKKIHSSKSRSKARNIKRYLIAAVISAITAIAGVYEYYDHRTSENITQQSISQSTYKANEGQAVLILADGTNVSLNQDKTEVLSVQENIEVVGSDGLLSYSKHDFQEESKLIYNILRTPGGVQYHLVLSDGTKVWLNGNSEIRYPVAFVGEDRPIELSGEAYFEVAKSNKPFKVHARETTVQVLGTHFNVKAYKDDTDIKTTLLEGAVKVKNLAKEQLLKPGQQAISSGSDLIVNNTDVELAVGWRKGLFTFNNEPLEQVMKQISRWYNMEVTFSKSQSKILFTGIIPVRDDIKKALSPVEEAANIRCEIKGDKITVTENNN